MLKLTEENRKWWILIAMATSLSLVFIDQTAVSVALPQMQEDFNATDVGIQWVVNAYLLTLAALLIIGGKIGDLVGHRRTFLVGVVIFILSSVACALANSAKGVIIGRAIQGIGGAFMIPATGVIVVNAFTDEERGRAMGIYISIASIFLSIGPLLGGLLTQFFTWRAVFWINFPISLISIILTLTTVLKEKKPKRISIDWFGFVLSTISLFCLIIALMEAVNLGWSSPAILSLFATSIVCAILFCVYEKKSANPLVDLNFFKNKSFVGAVIILAITQFNFIIIIFWMFYLQNVLGFLPATAGLLMLPVTVPLIFLGPVAGYVRDRFGPRLPIIIGSFAIALSYGWVGITCWFHQYIWIFPGFLLLGMSTPFVISSCMNQGFSTVHASKRGAAGGLLNAFRQIGRSLGLAVIGSTITNLNQWQLSQFILNADEDIKKIQLSQMDNILGNQTIFKQVMLQVTDIEAHEIQQAAIHAYTFAFSGSMFVVAAGAILALLFALRLPRKIDRN